jgi:hypothetical protein
VSDYPTEQELEALAKWPISDMDGLWAEIRRLWHFGDWGYSVEGGMWRLATGGWSGNEDVIEALKANRIFWLMCWQRSERGGLFWFKPWREHAQSEEE